MNPDEIKYIVRTHESAVTKKGRFRDFHYDEPFSSEQTARDLLFHRESHGSLYPVIRRMDLIEVQGGKERVIDFMHNINYSWDFVVAHSK